MMMCTGRYTVIHSGVFYLPVYPDWVHVKKVETENKIKRAVPTRVLHSCTVQVLVLPVCTRVYMYTTCTVPGVF
jgi:hypothetical protein